MIRDSVEFLEFTLTERNGIDLSGDTVEAAIVPRGSTGSPTWLPCTHLSGTTWRTTSVITWSTANYPDSSYVVYARVTDTPEQPRAELGNLYIRP